MWVTTTKHNHKQPTRNVKCCTRQLVEPVEQPSYASAVAVSPASTSLSSSSSPATFLLTFPTVFLPMSPDEAAACVNFYQRRYNSKPVFTLVHALLLRALERRIDATLLLHHQLFPAGAFVRMSNRSPKDGEPLIDHRAMAYQENLEREMQCIATVTDEHQKDALVSQAKLRAFFAYRDHLRVSSGKEALNLLLSSERVFSDLLLALDNSQIPGDVWSTNICLRKWEPLLREDYEFRTFVHRGVMTAISQYNNYCTYPQLLHQRDFIGTLIQQFWNKQVKHLLPYESYVLDIALLNVCNSCGGPSACTEHPPPLAVVVELNPFTPGTGPALFDWSLDRTQLEEGPCEIRLRTEPLPPETVETYLQVSTPPAEGENPTWCQVLACYETEFTAEPSVDPTASGCGVM
eukprot:TRINITY_DN2093_c0_g1_i2.p1 TRINITY_DN2093_c0_g1~~TRINITY_DN2093_c0_g1_i2.p1  ORF type:complete len:405 (+),score=73.90 TRINITY_DN2093_c0_g1_i2:347-1561(+)